MKYNGNMGFPFGLKFFFFSGSWHQWQSSNCSWEGGDEAPLNYCSPSGKDALKVIFNLVWNAHGNTESTSTINHPFILSLCYPTPASTPCALVAVYSAQFTYQGNPCSHREIKQTPHRQYLGSGSNPGFWFCEPAALRATSLYRPILPMLGR